VLSAAAVKRAATCAASIALAICFFTHLPLNSSDLATEPIVLTSVTSTEARLTFSNSSDPQNVRFETEYDLLGEWEYVVTVQTHVDRKNSVIKVRVGNLIAKKSIDSDISGAEVIYFEESKLILRDSSDELHIFSECLDKYLIDENNSIIWTSDEYDEVEVNP
jgi:hypothetical protein